MFKHIVVPLDGSRLAEAALPAAAFLAEKLGATVTLLHIIEHDAPEAVHGERHLKDPGEADTYLERITRQAFARGVSVRGHVHTDETANVPRGIVAHGDELAPDLIVMCTHGRGGLSDLISGNIAQQVVARGTIPVLLVRPPEEPGAAFPAFTIERILVPLDGNPEHEQGLPAAEELARACGAQVNLVLVVPTLTTLHGREAASGMLLPGATRAMLDLAQQDAENYLRKVGARLAQGQVAAAAQVARGEPVASIVDTARALGVDLLVLGTHGKAGTDAFWSGSLSPKIFSRLQVPMLLVPVRSE